MKPSKETIDEAIALFENEIEEYKKAITYLKTKYATNTKKNERGNE